MFAKASLHRAEQLNAGAFFPVSVHGCLLSVWNGVVFVKAAEMVNADNVIHLEAVPEPCNPPIVSCLSVVIPAVERIAPQLAVCREAVWRAARYSRGDILTVQLEKFWVRPCIRAVHRNVNRDIAYDSDALVIGVFTQLIPLGKKLELQVLLELNVKIQLSAVVVHRVCPAQTDILRPLCPRLSLKTFFYCHKQSVIRQPPAIF